MKFYTPLLLLVLFTTGCSSVPQSKEVLINQPTPVVILPRTIPESIDVNCSMIATQVRTAAILRDSGASQLDVANTIEQSQLFPSGPLIREVFSRWDMGPAAGSRNTYATCKAITFDKMVAALRKAEQDFVPAPPTFISPKFKK